jgi:8-oxo-dGTP diphosphatase
MSVAVVAAALVRDGAVLAARRSRPAELAGRWEFPGGKVEPGEDGPAALARECLEELGVHVDVGRLLGRAADGRVELTLYVAALVQGEPHAGESHDALRWLDVSSLESVDWLPLDAELLPQARLALP